MLENSFIHLPGIGENTERALWQQGILHWDHLAEMAEEALGPKRGRSCLVGLEESRSAMESGELAYFQERLGSAHAWRLIPRCEDSVAYLDIETTGLGFPPYAKSTSVAVSFRGELYVEHEPAVKRALFEKLENEAKMWVTFNGLTFDLPFLRRELGLDFAQPHVDLRVWMRRHGFKGGLKKIQIALPQIRQRDSMDIDGYDAVRLWRMHERGVPGALETLKTYNAEDTVVLEDLLHLTWDLERTRQETLSLPERTKPCSPAITSRVHESVYEMLRGQGTWEVPQGW